MSYKVKNLMKEIKEVNEEMVSGQGMDDIEDLINMVLRESVMQFLIFAVKRQTMFVALGKMNQWLKKNAKLFDALTAKLAYTT